MMNWEMRWLGLNGSEFQGGPLGNFQLDIVGFLAVLGEGSVLANAQVSALSKLFYLPRLLPAPQALLRPTRPSTLSPTTAEVTAVYSGNHKHHIHHVANVLLGGEMKTYTVRCVVIRKKMDNEFAPPRRMTTWLGSSKTMSPKLGPPPVKSKTYGPLALVTIFGCILSIALFIVSFVQGDGMSLIADIMLSFLSTFIGIGNKWELKLVQRHPGNEAPDGDVVIRYPNGSYLIVKCDEDVARELYFAPEEIDYNVKNPAYYRLISLVGTLMLMLAVIFLANASLTLQFCWSGAYIMINAAHWIAAAVPQRLHWDLSCYDIQEQSIDGGPTNPNFTIALWKAIVFTQSTDWVHNGKAAPRTKVWDAWLEKAQERIEEEIASKDKTSRLGNLISPMWPDSTPREGLVFNLPEWDAKAEWNKLSAEMNAGDKPVTRRRPGIPQTKTDAITFQQEV